MSDITRYMRVVKTTYGQQRYEKIARVSSSDACKSSSAYRTAPSTQTALPAFEPTATTLSPQSPELIDDDGRHVPTFIYEASDYGATMQWLDVVVKYAHKGQAGAAHVPEQVLRVVQHIESHFSVPADFECNHKYGPHSGLTFETRLARAYAHELLPLKPGPAPARMCLTCAQLGHSYRTCPDGF